MMIISIDLVTSIKLEGVGIVIFKRKEGGL